MSTPFIKMHGLGNDFVIIDSLDSTINLSAHEIQQLADRRRGVGFDQLLIIESSQSNDADFFFRIFNADGSEAEQCGNGLRCVARYLYDQDRFEKIAHIACKGGSMEATIENDGQVRVNMGTPNFAPEKVPFNAQTEQLIYSLTLDDVELRIGVISMGNPHAIICVDDMDTVDIATVGQAVSTHPDFPKGVNVGFMQVTQPYQACLRVYERGVGETPACGSGACAAMVYGHKLGILDREVSIIQPGGDLLIEWAGGNNPVFMTGPAEVAFRGHLIL